MELKKYGIVVIGCGSMGESHLNGICNNKRISIIGVVDVNEERAQKKCEKYKANSWSISYSEFLIRDDVDIIIIATYPSSHLSITRDCIQAGKHVLCEKPIAGNIKEAEEFVKIAKNAKVKVLVGHILRYNSTYRKVAEMIQNGAIGKPIIMRISQTKDVMENWESILTLLKESSPIIDCGVHYIDVMRWFTNSDVVNISGIGQNLEIQIPQGKYNYGIIILKFTDGSVGYYETGWGHTIPNNNTKEFIGPKGRINIIYQSQREKSEQHFGNLIQYHNLEEKIHTEINMEYKSKPTGIQLNYLIKMIEEDIDHRPFLEDVFRAMQEAILGDMAIHEGRTFKVLDEYKKIKWNSID